MRRLIFYSFVLCLLTNTSKSQTIINIDSSINKIDTITDGSDDPKVFIKTEKPAEFPGGQTAWQEFLKKNLNSDVGILMGAPAGTYMVIVRFVIGKNGALRNFAAETKFGYGMEIEAIRVIKESPKWIPAFQNGHPVNSYLRQPITYVVRSK